jgi:hypothetical protein
MGLLRRFLRLSRDERRLLVRATLLLTAIHLGLGRMPFTMLRRLAIARRPARPPTGDDRALADRVVWAVTAAAERLPGPPTCLSRALAVQAMLARRGYPSRLHVGVTRGQQGQVEGHAWVESEGRILIGGSASNVRQFTRLAAFDAEVPVALRTAGPPPGAR